MSQDFKARRLWTEEQLAADALKVRREHGYADNEWAFDMLECLSRLQFTRSVPVKHFTRAPGGDPAFVSYEPLELHISYEVHDKALKQDEWARVVLAHETAHLRLHSDGRNAFSPIRLAESSWVIKEQRVEWQAQTWSSYFLLPDAIVRDAGSIDALVELCKVDEETASFRLSQIREADKRRALASACSNCGEFSAMRFSSGFRCGNCNNTIL